MKTCSKCKIEKHRSAFTKDRQRPDGLYSYCRACRSLYVKTDPARARDRARYPSRGSALRASLRKKYKDNPEKYRIRAAEYRTEHSAKHREASLAWQRTNKGRANARNAAYKASKKFAVPSWLSREQKIQIAWFYTIAKELQWLSEERLEVDHIIPLRGKDVSGLHVPWNLQVIPKSLNCAKRNRLVG